MSAPPRIEIVGGGLAGLALGLALRRAAIPVTVYESGHYPRHRVCGEFITGLDATTIATLGLAPLLAGALQHHEVAWFLDGRRMQLQHLPEPALGLSRYALDARIADAFTQAGGDLQTGGRVADLSPRPGLVLANGRQRGRSDWLGLKFHVHDIALTRDLELHLGAEAYVGLSRVEDGAVNVCGLFRRRAVDLGVETAAAGTAVDSTARTHAHASPAVMLRYLDACGLTALAERLRAGEIETASFCAVAGLRFGRASIVRGAVRIGDAFAMIPPFTGNGMAMAFQSAALAVDPLVRYARGETTWRQACLATHAALRGRFGLRLASADVLHAFLLRPQRQRWLATLSRARLLPLRPLYAALH
jgi:menaquinone-9 beta-reductase